jgi:hypothetical protein
MTTSLRLTLVCVLASACEINIGDTDITAGDTTGPLTTSSGTTTTDGSTTDEPTTDEPTTGPTSGTSTTTTTDATTTTTTDATTTTTTTTDATTTTTTDATTGTSSTTDDTTGGAGLSWEKDVYPVIVEGTCGCHGGGSGGLKMTNAMDSYANIVDVDATQVQFKRVAPGDPANSYFLAKVAGTAGMAPFNSGSPDQMPKGGAPKGQMAIDILTQWIADGALP